MAQVTLERILQAITTLEPEELLQVQQAIQARLPPADYSPEEERVLQESVWRLHRYLTLHLPVEWRITISLRGPKRPARVGFSAFSRCQCPAQSKCSACRPR